MCGIVAYIGKKDAFPVLIKGLSRLEYRGYDSAGIALMESNKINLYKKQGKVADLVEFTQNENINGSIGIGHTRWATHGEPNDTNAHPHYSMDKRIALIHNGIIENYDSIREKLISRGYEFKSQTDTEALVHLIDDIQKREGVSLYEAVCQALKSVVGAYAIVVISEEYPDQLIAARKSSPLVVGIGNGNEFYLASDATPIIEYTNQVVYLNDEEIAVLDRNEGLKITNIAQQEKTPYIQELELQIEALEKGGYEHFMLKEIFEQPRSIHDCFRGRLNATQGVVQLGGVKDYEKRILNAKRIIFVACGTSWHACQVGEYLIEGLARINVEVEYASEFRYRNPILNERDVVLLFFNQEKLLIQLLL